MREANTHTHVRACSSSTLCVLWGAVFTKLPWWLFSRRTPNTNFRPGCVLVPVKSCCQVTGHAPQRCNEAFCAEASMTFSTVRMLLCMTHHDKQKWDDADCWKLPHLKQLQLCDLTRLFKICLFSSFCSTCKTRAKELHQKLSRTVQSSLLLNVYLANLPKKENVQTKWFKDPL